MSPSNQDSYPSNPNRLARRNLLLAAGAVALSGVIILGSAIADATFNYLRSNAPVTLDTGEPAQDPLADAWLDDVSLTPTEAYTGPEAVDVAEAAPDPDR